MCISYQNPTQRAQNSDEATCNAKLPWSMPRRSVERLIAMSKHADWKIRVVPAGHPATPHDTLEALAVDYDYQVRSWVVRNMSTPDSVLRLLSVDGDTRIAAYARLRLNNTAN